MRARSQSSEVLPILTFMSRRGNNYSMLRIQQDESHTRAASRRRGPEAWNRHNVQRSWKPQASSSPSSSTSYRAPRPSRSLHEHAHRWPRPTTNSSITEACTASGSRTRHHPCYARCPSQFSWKEEYEPENDVGNFRSYF